MARLKSCPDTKRQGWQCHLFAYLCGIITLGIVAVTVWASLRRHSKIIMLNELEFSYTPVRDKVRDLREYL